MEKKFKKIIGFLALFLCIVFVWSPLAALFSMIISGVIFAIIGGFFITSIGIYLFFYYLIPEISKSVSKLCIYHEIKTDKNPNGETIWKKISLVFFYNVLLTIPMLLTILYLLNLPTLKMSGRMELSGIDIGIIIALSIIPGLFVTLRLIGNPTYQGVTYLRYVVIKKSFYGSVEEIKKIKDDISSFFSTLIIGTILFLFLLYCSDYFSNLSYFTFFKRYIPTMAPFEFFLYIIGYVCTLFILTVIGELILMRCKPLESK
jgi:hypothetical protein